jgi:hypothetical protein
MKVDWSGQFGGRLLLSAELSSWEICIRHESGGTRIFALDMSVTDGYMESHIDTVNLYQSKLERLHQKVEHPSKF